MTSTHDNELRHQGAKGGARTQSLPHVADIPIVEATTRIPASREREFQFIAVKNVPGSSASILYICLANNAATPVYGWVQVATG